MAKKEKSAASIVIHAPGTMTKRGRKDIATWLRWHATNLMKHGNHLTQKQFRGSFRYME